MIETEDISHHRKTTGLWATIGKEVAQTERVEKERRNRPRFLAADAACQLDIVEGADGGTIDVAVRDVSAAGVCLLSAAALPISACVRLHPPGDAHADMETVNGLVTYCRKTDLQFRIGVRFADRRSPAGAPADEQPTH